MRRKQDIITFLSFAVVSVSAAFAGCGSKQPEPNKPPETIRGISVIVAHETTVPDWLEVVGTVRAARTAQVSSQMTGNIVEVRAHEGDRVQVGQVLAVIDDAQPRAAENQATAALAAAEKEVTAADSDFALAGTTLKRYQQLYDKKSVSPQEFDEVKARYQSAEARRDMAEAGTAEASAALAQARTSLGYTHIHAPFSGVVTAKMADAGTLAAPGMTLFTIEETRNYRLEATVDERDIHLVQIGEAAPVTIDSLGSAPMAGNVAQIVPTADTASHSFLVKIALPTDAHLRSGLFGRARFARDKRQALLIPLSAIVQRGQLEGVYVINPDRVAELRYVTLGAKAGDRIEVLSGLKDGETIVATPGEREFGGKRIAMQP
ncbi:MAG TPA: efflux RND transporter periplasmic adaptor subunit [Candidatus Dormibacteraeota bacterium]|nr:efflux RND transporter periplasmic adaptor subunit [Candidatus Dormibacteraeota bacterium]